MYGNFFCLAFSRIWVKHFQLFAYAKQVNVKHARRVWQAALVKSVPHFAADAPVFRRLVRRMRLVSRRLMRNMRLNAAGAAGAPVFRRLSAAGCACLRQVRLLF